MHCGLFIRFSFLKTSSNSRNQPLITSSVAPLALAFSKVLLFITFKSSFHLPKNPKYLFFVGKPLTNRCFIFIISIYSSVYFKTSLQVDNWPQSSRVTIRCTKYFSSSDDRIDGRPIFGFNYRCVCKDKVLNGILK